VPLKRINNPQLRSVAEWSIAVVAAVFLFLALRTFVIRVANVDGLSMEPTLYHRDIVILSRLTYLFSDPKPGDIVAFPYKENNSEHYIKRVVGTPGDVIDMRGGFFYVNGERLDDAFSDSPVASYGDIGYPYTVGDGVYFVLGDNRNGSKDSRYGAVGCIPKRDIIGKVVVRVWPLGRFGAAG